MITLVEVVWVGLLGLVGGVTVLALPDALGWKAAAAGMGASVLLHVAVRLAIDYKRPSVRGD